MSLQQHTPAAVRPPPRPLAPALGWPMLFCQLALASPFIVSAITKLADFAAARAEMASVTGLPEFAAPIAVAVILVQTVGSACLFGGPLARRFGVLLLAGFTLAATLVAHEVFGLEGPARARELVTVCEHLGLIAGLALLLRASPA